MSESTSDEWTPEPVEGTPVTQWLDIDRIREQWEESYRGMPAEQSAALLQRHAAAIRGAAEDHRAAHPLRPYRRLPGSQPRTWRRRLTSLLRIRTGSPRRGGL